MKNLYKYPQQNRLFFYALLISTLLMSTSFLAYAAPSAKVINDPISCNDDADDDADVTFVYVPGTPYTIELTTLVDTQGVALSNCDSVSILSTKPKWKLKKTRKKRQTSVAQDVYKFTKGLFSGEPSPFQFVLYDLDGGKLENKDQVVIQSPHGRLLGLTKSGKLRANRKYFAKNEVFTIINTHGKKDFHGKSEIALVSYTGKYITAKTSGGFDVKVGKNKAKSKKPKKNEKFIIKSFSKSATKQLGEVYSSANKTRVVLTKMLGVAYGAFSHKPINEIFEDASPVVQPAACKYSLKAEEAELVIKDEPDDADKPGYDPSKIGFLKTKFKDGKEYAKKLPIALANLMKNQVCKQVKKERRKREHQQHGDNTAQLSFELDIPNTDLGASAFFTLGNKTNDVPVWHTALMAGEKTLNDNLLTKAIPSLKHALGGIKVTKFVAIVSNGSGVIDINKMGGELGELLADFQSSTKVHGQFKNQPNGKIKLHPGVNIFGEVEGATSGPLAVVSEAVFPNSTQGGKRWKISGVMGKSVLKAVIGNSGKLTDGDTPDFHDKSNFALNVWIPSHTPIPFNIINNKKILHTEVQQARLSFDLSSSYSGGVSSKGIKVSVKSWAHYWLLNKSFAIEAEGKVALKNGGISGAIDGLYSVKASEDPFNLIPGFKELGIHMTKLRVGGAIDIKKGAKRGELDISLASELKVGRQKVQSAFDLILEKKSATKITIKELRVSLSSPGDKPIKLKNLGLLGKIPLANELVIDKGAVGIMPKAKGIPDFYLAGGTTWSRTGMGGKVAIMKTSPKGSREEDFFIFVSSNDFSLASLLPKAKKFDVPRSVLTMLKLPKTMLMFNTLKKDGELETADFPEPMQAIFEGLTSGDEKSISLQGNSLSIVSALSFDEKETGVIMDGFKKIGISKFGPTGPLLIAGSIGLKAGKLALDIDAHLPGFKIPEKIGGVVNPVGKIFKPKGSDGLDLFIRLVGEGTESRVETGIKGKMTINLPRVDDITKMDSQDLEASLYVKATASSELGLEASASKKGIWTDPLGLNSNISIKDTSILVDIVTSAAGNLSMDFGLGGSIIFEIKDKDGKSKKLQYDADLIVGGGGLAYPPYVSPTKFGLNLGADRISIDSAVRVADAVLDGILTGGMINLIIDGDKKNPLAPGLPKGPIKDGINQLRKGLAKQSLPKLLHLDDIPIPSAELRPAKGKDKVRFYIATPGATIPGREDTMNGLGFSLTGALSFDLLGKKTKVGEMDVTLSAAEGLRIYGRVEKIELGKGKSKLILGHPKGSEIDLKASVEETYFNLLAGIKLDPLLDDQTAISLRADGTSFYIKKDFKSFFGMELDIKSAVAVPPVFTVKATIDNRINKVVEDTLLPAFGVPKLIIKEIAKAQPLVIEHFKLDADLGAFATGGGKGINVDIKPKYFGDSRPTIKARIPAIDWKHPEKILLGSQELQNQILASLIDYAVDKQIAIKLPALPDLKVISIKKAEIGGTKRDYSFDDYSSYVKAANSEAKKIKAPLKKVYTKAAWNKLAKKPQQGVFKLSGDSYLLGIHEKIDLQLSPKDMRFKTTVNILNGEVETKISAKSAIKNNKIVPPMLFNAEISLGINDFVSNNVMPALGIPKQVIDGLKSATPILINKVAFNGELASIVKGNKKLHVDLDTVFFGDTKNMKVVPADLKISNVKEPLASLLAGPEILKQLSVAFVEYLSEHPKTEKDLPALTMDFVLFKLDKLYLGGKKAKHLDKEDKKFFKYKGKTENIFVIKGGIKLPASHPKADMKFSKTKLKLHFTDTLIKDAVSASFNSVGEMTATGPKNISFDAVVNLKKLNKWFDKQVIGKLPSEIKKVVGGVRVVVNKAELKGNFENFFLKHQQADMKLWMTVSGRKVQKTIPVFTLGASVKNIAKQDLAMTGLVAQIAGIIIDEGMKKLIGINLKDVEAKAKAVGAQAKKTVTSATSAIKGAVGKTFRGAVSLVTDIFGRHKRRNKKTKGTKPWFEPKDTVHIVNDAQGLCFTAHPNNNVYMKTCDPVDKYQMWGFAAAGTAPWLRFQNIGAGKCLSGGTNRSTHPQYVVDFCEELVTSSTQTFRFGVPRAHKKSKWGDYVVHNVPSYHYHGSEIDCLFTSKPPAGKISQHDCGINNNDFRFILLKGATDIKQWKKMPGGAIDITGNKSTTWIAGTNHYPYQYQGRWLKHGNIKINTIDVAANGDVWATGINNKIWHRPIKTKKWQQFKGPLTVKGFEAGARDIGVGGGRVWIVSNEYIKDGNFRLYSYYKNAWHRSGDSALRIDVNSAGYAHRLKANIAGSEKGYLYYSLDGSKRTLVKGLNGNKKTVVSGIDIGLSSSGGTPRIVGTDGQVYLYNKGQYIRAPNANKDKPIVSIGINTDKQLLAVDSKGDIYLSKRHILYK